MRKIGWHNLRYRKNKGTSCLIVLLIIILICLTAWLAMLQFGRKPKNSLPIADSLNVKIVKVADEMPLPATPGETVTAKAPTPETLKQARMIAKSDYILIEKSRHLLHYYHDGKLLASYSVALGKNTADKAKEGDNATPEGHYEVNYIKDSSGWTHDFKDGKGAVKGAYGPFFIALYTGAKGSFSGKTWRGIGIHGTHDSASIGTNASEGCIRLHNGDLLKLKAAIEKTPQVPVDIIK
ncbi:MAG: L,D-transpeptidase [Candidatus Cloacimonas sp.]|jgi:lipoprotein-anchoring transpeptidase ErfK/SrfK|nr:L,D-transpeptidase [Candidatus Cloacimonas sp.]